MMRVNSQETSPPLLNHSPVYQGGVTFNEVEEQRCPKASPLSLTGALKAPIKNEEDEKRSKRKRRVEQPREPVPTEVAKEETSSEQRGGEGGREWALKPTKSNQCSPPLLKKQHMLKLEMKQGENKGLKLKKAASLN